MSIALRKLNTSSGMMFNSCFATDSEPGVVAVLRSYPSLAEQALQQRQIPFDIIFDQQLEHLGKYNGAVKKAWAVSPDQDGIIDIPIAKEGKFMVVRISGLKVYQIVVLEKK